MSLNSGTRAGLKIDTSSDVGRDECRSPANRIHRDYKQPRWATVHIQNIDKVFATAVPDDGSPKIRVDCDGVGEGGASLTDQGENVNASLWLSLEKITELHRQLIEAQKKAKRDYCDGEGDQ